MAYKTSIPRAGRVLSVKGHARTPQDLEEAIGSAILSPSQGRIPPRLGSEGLLRGYSEMPWLRAVVHKISQAVGATTWRVLVPVNPQNGRAIRQYKLQRASMEYRHSVEKQNRRKGELKEIEDHPLLDLLTDANPRLIGQNVFQITQQHIDLVGEAFWLLEKNIMKVPVAIWPIPPTWVKELPTDDKPFYRLDLGGKQFQIPVTEIIPFLDPDPANPYGRGAGVARALGDELEIDEYTAKHIKGFYVNRARPDIIISADNLSRENTRRLEERWIEQHQGFWNSFKPHFLNRKVQVDELGQSFENQQLNQLRTKERDTVLQVFGVPPELFGVLNASNRSTINASDFFWTKHIVAPRVELIRNNIQKHLVPLYDERLIVDFQSPIAQDKQHQLEVMRTMPAAFTINEWRDEAERESLGERGESFIRQMQDNEIPINGDGQDGESPSEPEPVPDQEEELTRNLLENGFKDRIRDRLRHQLLEHGKAVNGKDG